MLARLLHQLGDDRQRRQSGEPDGIGRDQDADRGGEKDLARFVGKLRLGRQMRQLRMDRNDQWLQPRQGLLNF